MTAARPWMKFYARDWRGDQALRMVSLAARGLWIECLSIMHEATPYGHLVVNGKPVEDDVLARLVGASVEEVRTLRDELLESGVANLGRNGVLVSRRMVRDEVRAKKGRKAVKRRYSQSAVKSEENDTPNRSPRQEPTTQKPEARSQKPDKPPDPPRQPSGSMPADVRAVMEAGGFVTPPPDIAQLRQWYDAGADLDQDILPCVRAVAASVMRRTGRAPLKLKLFDQAVLEKLARDQAEIARLRRVARDYGGETAAVVAAR